MSQYRPIPILLVALLALGVLFLPYSEEAVTKALPALALTVLIIGLMATNSMPEFQISVLFFVLALAFQIAPADIVFSGLRSSAFWLIVGGVIIGIAAEKTGLGRTVAELFISRLSQSYPRLIAGIVFVAILLAFLIPAAIARMIILMPIVLALADQLGFAPGTKGRTGLVLAVTVASFYMPMAILPSNLPNVLLAGMADTLYDVKITYGLYLLMHFPVAGALKALVLIGLIRLLFNDQIRASRSEHEIPPALSSRGRRLAIIIAITVAVWATDFIHGIAPGWVAVVAASVCLMPGIGAVKFDELKGKTAGFVALFNIATVIGLGAVIAITGAGELIASGLLAATEFKPGESAYAYGMFSAINILMTFVATLPGTIAVLAPFADNIAAASNLPLITVLMIIANGYSTVFLPYQAPPILAGLRLGGVSLADGARLTLALSLVTVLTLLPLNFIWWKVLGFIP